MSHLRSIAGAPLLVLLVAADAAPQPDPAWVAEIQKARSEREERLRSETGWLTLAGLFWLEPGANAFGSDPAHPVVLSAPGVPARAGSLDLDGERVTLRPDPEATVTIAGKAAGERILLDDTAEAGPDVVEVGRLRFLVIRRGERFGVRVKDPEHPRRTGFKGLEYFPLDPRLHVPAVLVPYEAPREVQVLTAVGTSSPMVVPGVLEFSIGDRKVTLLPFLESPEATELWLIFADATSGKESYGFRYLYAPLEGTQVDLDFNRAYNPPCAFSPYATCPLPPRENRLDLRLAAGERAWHER